MMGVKVEEGKHHPKLLNYDANATESSTDQEDDKRRRKFRYSGPSVMEPRLSQMSDNLLLMKSIKRIQIANLLKFHFPVKRDDEDLQLLRLCIIYGY